MSEVHWASTERKARRRKYIGLVQRGRPDEEVHWAITERKARRRKYIGLVQRGRPDVGSTLG